MKMIMSISLVASMFITLTTNPMTMVIMIITQCMLICLMLFMCLSMTWYSYILFLIFMGGLMILFVYICSMASNELFISDTNSKMMMIIPVLAISMVMMSSTFKMNVIQVGKMEIILKMMTLSSMPMLLMCMFFLLFTLIVVVEISKMNMGPLRALKYKK